MLYFKERVELPLMSLLSRGRKELKNRHTFAIYYIIYILISPIQGERVLVLSALGIKRATRAHYWRQEARPIHSPPLNPEQCLYLLPIKL